MADNPLLTMFDNSRGGNGNPLLDAYDASTVDAGSIASVTGKQPAKPKAPSLADTIRDPNSLSEIVARRDSEAQRNPNEGNLQAPTDTWADTGRKIVEHIGPGFKAGLGGALQALIEGAAQPDPNMPLTSDERAGLQARMEQGIATLRERGAMPGQQMHDEATRDLRENAFAPGDSTAKYYAGMFADSMIQMLPTIATTIATRSPTAGAALTFGQVAGQQYGDSREEGRATSAAAVDALFMGTAEAVGERITLGMLMKPGGKFLPRLMKQMVGEGVQEMGTQVLQTGYDMGVLNPDMTWKEAVEQVRDAGIVGAMMGGGMATIAAPFHQPDVAAPVPQDIDRAAVNAMSPSQGQPLARPIDDGKSDIPLSAEDRASPISDNILQAGKNVMADALAEVGAAPARAPAPKRAPVKAAADTFSRMVQITLGSESRNRDFDSKGNVLTSPAGAKGKMQVLDGTNTDPGFGVRPAADNSLAERARVGRDYLAAMLRRYNGDPAKMWAAYNWGPGALDDAIKAHGGAWLDHAPAETRAYVMKNLSQLGQAGFNTETGEVATINAPEQPELETESAMDFAARILGADFMDADTAPAAEPAAPGVSAVPEVPTAPAPADAVAQAAAEPFPAIPAAPSDGDIRGEAIDGEWSRFSDTSGTLRIPRAQMPQIEASHRGAFANFLKGRGITSHDIAIPASTLKPTQDEYSEDRIASAAEREGGNRAILTSNDGYIVDGHHQWMAARDKGENIRAIMLDAPIADVLQAGHDFPSSFAEEPAAFDATGATPVRDRVKRDQRANTEVSLSHFLAAHGGIADEASGTSKGHALRSGRNLQEFVPGFGSLIRPSGKKMDEVRELLVEYGWLPEGATEDDALQLLDANRFNPVYHPTSERALREGSREDENLARQQDALDFVRAEAEALGLEGLTATDLERAATLTLAEGYSERDALFAAIEQKMAEEFDSYPATLKGEYHVPFDGEGAPGWEAVQEPFAESENRSADQEGGERSTVEPRAEAEGQDAAGQSGEAESSQVTIADTASGKGITVTGATPEQIDAIHAALPDKVTRPVPNRDGGLLYSKKHEAAIRDALRNATPAPTSDAAPAIRAGEGQVTPVTPDTRQEPEQLPAAEAPAASLTVERVEKRKSGQHGSGSKRTIVHMSDGREVELVGIHTGPTVRTDSATGVTTDVSNNYHWEAHTLPGAQGTVQIGTGFSEAEALKRLPAAIEADREKRRAAQEEKFRAIDEGFAQNRAVMGQFKKGDAVEFDHGNFYRDGSARTFTGIVKEVQSKEQGIISVTSDTGGEYAVAARNLRPRAVEALVPSPGPAKPNPEPQAKPTKPKAAGQNPHVNNGERYTVSERVDYLTAGETYVIESAGKKGAYFRNAETGAGTHLQNYQIKKALADGVMTLAAPAPSPAMAKIRALDEERKAAVGNQSKEAVVKRKLRALAKTIPADDETAVMAIDVMATRLDMNLDPRSRDIDFAPAEGVTNPVTPQAPQQTNGTLSGDAEQEANGYGSRDVGAMSANLRDAVERINGQPEQQRTILDAISRGVIQDGDMLLMGSPRWALENGYADIGPTNNGRRGRLTDAGRAKLAELTGETAAPARPAGYGTANKIISADRAQQARERLRAKLDGNTLNSGVDPELLAEGVVLAAFHIEAGARKFADFARAVADDLGRSMADLKPYLRAWYNGARDMLEDSGADIDGMDGPGAVRAALTMIEDRGGAPAASGEGRNPLQTPEVAAEPATAAPGRIEQAFIDAFESGRAFISITEARAFAAQELGIKIDPGSELAKALDEQIESAIVRVARKIAVRNEGNPLAAYQALVDLYGRQPRLGVRTSTSVEQQAYSTPVPLAYLASQLAGINQNTTVYEPSAGNGALLIDARPTYVTANELNPDRARQLRAFLPGGTVTENDAAEERPAEQFDVIIANPPFGAVKDDAGNTVRFDVGGNYSTNEIDHAIAMKALAAMKDDGKAVLIVGGINKTITDPQKRADAYNGKAKREFYFRLYSEYNVSDHFTVDGSLYAKQGAGWPVDVIVINGRGKSSLRLPAVSAPRQYASWDALQEVLTNDRNTQAAGAVRGTDGIAAGESTRADTANVRDTGSERAGRDNGQRGRDTARQPGAVRAGPADGQSSGLRVDAERAGVGEAAPAPERGADAGRDPVTVAPTPEVEENARQVAYQAGSRSGGMGTLVPVNMQTAISDALGALAMRRGSIDAYVADRLGYSAQQLVDSFGAEQVDAIALAIDNIERGAGFIIGDQTGIGKGRVNAAVIRYAIRRGLNAIFVTEKPNLYADMFRDMEDIGIDKMLGRPINAVMTNSNQSVPLPDAKDGEKRTLKSGSDAKKHDAMLRDISLKGLKAAGVDVLLTTYSQMQTVQGKATVRQEVIRRLANGGVVMFDESHNAGGTQNAFKEKGAAPNRAEFARELVKDAQGVFYSSATYAKRPDVMDLYAATDMKLAVEDLEKLGEAIAKGGVPMQQVVAAMLARSGQYVRRERSFDGIEYNTPQIEVDRTQYNNVSTVLAAIQDFSENYVADAVAVVDQELRDSAENVAFDGSIGQAGASSTNFTAIMHNVVDQMLLAFAADDAADRAIQAIRAGEKPVITLASTLETFIEEYAEEIGAAPGDRIDITFADIFRRYLERTRRYTVKKPFADKGDKGERRRLTDEQLGPQGVRAFKDAMRLIDEAGIHTLPGSPIDHIIARIEKAGYQVGEITGRSMGIDYSGNDTVLKKRGQSERSIKGRLTAINGFNAGQIDAMILNKSGSTGLSLHASDKFKDQRKRRMIIVQADGNIDTHMQMLGRVHRTGQVVLPEYDQLVVGVPAARRPAAVLAKKMASLNANTTASRDSALTSAEVLDFMNVYGDQIAARLMADEPDIHLRLGNPLPADDHGFLKSEDAARKVTGRIPLLPIDMQEELYQRLEDEYRSLIAQKDAAGENALEAKTFDFDAELVDRKEVLPPVPGSDSPFADGVYVETVKVKRQGKPIPSADVVAQVAQGLEVDVPAGSPDAALKELQRQAQPINAARLRETYNAAKEYIDQAAASIKDAEKSKAEREKLDATLKNFQTIRNAIRPGDTVRVKTDNGNVYGVVMDVYRSGRAKNPAALGVWRARIAIVDAAREMTVTFSQMAVPGEKAQEGAIAIEKADTIGLFKIIDAFDEMQVDARETRSIVTGNLLAGFDYVNGKGAIINYTASGGQVRQGILLTREFNLEKHQQAMAIRLSTPEMVDAYMREGDGSLVAQGKTGQVSLQAIKRGNTLLVSAAKAKSAGGEFFLNRQLTAITGDFRSKAGGMVAETGLERTMDVARVLMEGGAKFEVPAGADDKAKELGRAIVERFRPTPPPAPVEKAMPQESVETVAGDFADVAQPERTMTQRQRGELEARQQQSMARRGGQEAISDQAGGLFSAERDQDALFSRTDGDAEAALEEWESILPRIKEAVKRLGLVDKINVMAVDRILDDLHVAGRYHAGVIQLALSSPQNPEYTLDHEAIHALRDLGLFKPSEWTALVKAATGDKKLMESVTERYGDKSAEVQAEEAVADMFAQWRAGRRSQSGFARQALQRLLDLLGALRRAIRGAGVEDQARDIMRRIASGEVGGRDPDGPGGGAPRDSRVGDAIERIASGPMADSLRDRADWIRTKMQDRFLPLLRAQQRIEMQTGKAISEKSDAYLAEELMTGKVGARLERLNGEMIAPLFDRMKALGLSVDEVETYLYARHAVERNARISSINSEFAEGTGSGMTDAEAAGILARADAEGKIPALEQAAELVDAILKFAVDTRVESGLLSQEEADAWRDTYQFYVPLRGRGELIPEVEADRPRFGSGINVKGKESKRAFGRKSRAANILAYSIMQAEEAIARAGRNEVAQAFYNLARDNPDEDFWKISRVTRKPFWNEGTGTVSYRNVSNLQPEDEPYTVSLTIGGQERRVTMNRDNPAAVRLAKAMRNLDAPAIGGPLRLMSQFNRYLSRVNTGWNPEFVISNALRDIQTATINLAGVDAKKIVSGTLLDYRKALGASWRANVKGHESGDWGKWYREFVDNGGRVYFNQIDDVNDIVDRIRRQTAVAATRADAAKMRAKSIARGTFELIDAANTGLENAVRLAAYKNAREAGMSPAKAASLAKNLTVNFNRRGDWGAAMNAMYLFYNASIQGTARMLQAAATPGQGGKRVRRILFGIAAVSFGLELLNAMLSGEDDDGESFYDKIGEFEKSRNIILMLPGQDRYLKIPMPYGYNVFATIGRSIASTVRGRPPMEGVSRIIGGMVDAFNPVGGTNSLLNLIAPTIADPVVDLYRNRDFADRPIYREQQPYGPEEPNTQMYWGSVNFIWKDVANGIGAATGGDEVLPGAIDINPEVLEYLWGTATGAAGTFIADRIVGNVEKAATGDWGDIEVNDLPMARKLMGAKPGWYDKAAYYTRAEEIEQIASRPKEYAERGDTDKAEAYAAEHAKALELVPHVKAAKREMKKIRAARNDIERAEEAGDMTAAEARAARKEVKQAEQAIVTQFNQAYVAAIDNPTRP